MNSLPKDIKELLHRGTVIPAHPLALDETRKLDESHQRLLTRYYLAAGVGGVAVGVHTTQFEIRKPEVALYERLLLLAAEEVKKAEKTLVMVAGVIGTTDQALKEAEVAAKAGYDLALLGLGGLQHLSEGELIRHAEKVAEVMPLFGFYLQPAVGGKLLSYDFWKAFADIPNVWAIKMAPFNRYHTLDVVRGVCHSDRWNEIALYTGNDDNIVADLLTAYQFKVGDELRRKEIVGGLLGHWAVWTKTVVDQFETIRKVKEERCGYDDLLTLGIEITDANAAFFDVKNNFQGCIGGLHEVLRRQGLMKGIWCLDPKDELSSGQAAEIDRIYRTYPHLNDDLFIKENIVKWRETK
ncbi:MAG: dihydrodipicolinate synthase family protein [Cyclobacteriaceae bacterium]|nr:dihydrodipicolinate synthase family protein [Cyclobacteriaceae bacterium]